MKRLIALLCLILYLVTLPLCSIAKDDHAPLLLEAVYHATKSSPERHWFFPYRDEWFVTPAKEYQHELARASLGMALSAFRDVTDQLEQKDQNIRAYLTKAGFTGLRSEQYDTTPTIDTIASMIGRKSIGDSTLIVVAISGGGYENEWLSNFTIGDGKRHEGFNSASQKVQERIRRYLSEEGVTGNIKLWLSGYSRAAAVANITAADMLESKLFTDVYAYTFATPRTTRQPKRYDSIFNIVGKFDPVPYVPFADWGYQRYGTDLYTPAQETDSDYSKKAASANSVSRQLTGKDFWNNPKINQQLRTIMDYLLQILPNSTVYKDHMQSIMINVWQDKSIMNLSKAIIEMMEDADLISEAKQFEMETMLNYLTNAAYTTITSNLFGIANNRWNNAVGLTDNIAHEHVPDVYIAWMFSTDDPDELFTGGDSYMRFVLNGELSLWICDGEGHFLWQVNKDGSLNGETASYIMDEPLPLHQRPIFYAEKRGKQTIVTVPKDKVYIFSFIANADNMVTYYGAEYDTEVIAGNIQKLHMLDVQKDQYYFAISDTEIISETNERFNGWDDMSFDLWDENLPYSPSVLTYLENPDEDQLTFSQMLWIAGGILVVLLSAITVTTILLVKRRRRKKAAALANAQPEAIEPSGD